MADYQDLYVEELDGTECRHVEEIEVRDGPMETVEVVGTEFAASAFGAGVTDAVTAASSAWSRSPVHTT